MSHDGGRRSANGPARALRRLLHPRALARGLALRPKLYCAVAAALAVLVLAPAGLPVSVRAVLAWDVGAVVYLAIALRLMATCPISAIRARAEREDETRFVFITIILIAIATSFSAVVGLIGEAKVATGSRKGLYLSLAALAILSSWLVMQVAYALHYAHDYYRPRPGTGATAGGLEFPGTTDPDYWDFLYFTTSIGATSQTSDVAIASRPLRRVALWHAVISFVFNTTIVALAINLAASLL